MLASFIGVGALLLSSSPAPTPTPAPVCLGLNDKPAPTQCNTVPLSNFTWTRFPNTQFYTPVGNPVSLGTWPYGESQSVFVPKDDDNYRLGRTYAPNETERALDDCKQLCVNLPDCIAVTVSGFETGVEFLYCRFSLGSFMPLDLKLAAWTLDLKPFDLLASVSLYSCPTLYVVNERLPSLAPGVLDRPTFPIPVNCSYPDFAVEPPPL